MKRVGSAREKPVKTGLSSSSTKPNLGRLWLLDHLAHLIRNLVHGSGSGPMGNYGSAGPMKIGPCLAHHPNTLKPGGVSEEEESCFGQQP